MYYANRNTVAFRTARDELFREWTTEHARALRHQEQRLEELSSSVADLIGRLDRLHADPQFSRVLDNYGYEAAREAVDDRRRMLAYAAAGSNSPTLTIAQLARVERTTRELDPADVKVLRTLATLRVDGSLVA